MLKAKDIMTKKVTTVKPNMSLRELAKLLIKKNICGAPVIAPGGKLLGVVSEEGVIFQDKKVHLPTFINVAMGFLTLDTKKFQEDIKKITATKVSEVMEKDMAVLSPDTDISEIATLMIEKDTSYCPVLKGKKLVGVVTKRDIVRSIAKGK